MASKLRAASARDLLAAAEDGPLSELQQARADLVRAQLAFITSRGSDAPPLLLLRAAMCLEPIDAGLARAAYLEALSAALFAAWPAPMAPCQRWHARQVRHRWSARSAGSASYRSLSPLAPTRCCSPATSPPRHR
jgi:hypothetical protein